MAKKKTGELKENSPTKYKVQGTFCLTGLRPQPYKSGDEVTEDCFASKDIVGDLEKQGFLVKM